MNAGPTVQRTSRLPTNMPFSRYSQRPRVSGSAAVSSNRAIGVIAWVLAGQYRAWASKSPSAESGPVATQCDLTSAIAAELAVAGFADPQVIGFGAVYRCEHRSLERIVAIKALATGLDAESLDRFLRERRAMGKPSEQPNIVNVFIVGTTPSGRPYIVLPYCPARWSQDGRCPADSPPVGCPAAPRQTCQKSVQGLRRASLGRFGIARIIGVFEAATGTVTASPAFAADEVHQVQVPASDIYRPNTMLFCALIVHAAVERRCNELIFAGFVRLISDAALKHRGAASTTRSAPSSSTRWRAVPGIGQPSQAN
jgi:Protein tyrosine and serine/threonine kinase